MLSAPGIGSGLDVDSIVTQIMEVEREPLNRLEIKREELELEVSAHGQLKSAAEALREAATNLSDGNANGTLTATSGDEALFEATVGEDAVAGLHTINVVSLATNHRLSSAAFADDSVDIGTGTVTLGTGDRTFAIEIRDGTLSGLRDTINQAAENTGVTATIINASDGAHLILTATETGTDASLSVTASSGVTALGFTELSTAQDAELEIDGLAVTSASNTVSDALSGVNITLYGVGSAALSVTNETQSLVDSVQSMVDAYNDLSGAIGSLQSGVLQGDSIPRTLEVRLRGEFIEPITVGDSDLEYIVNLGLSFDDSGVLSLDPAKLESAAADDIVRVTDALSSADHGVASRLVAALDAYTTSGGIVDSRKDGLEAQMRSVDRQIENKEFRLEKTEQRYLSQFTALDTLLSNLQTTSSYLSQQLGNLPFSNRSS